MRNTRDIALGTGKRGFAMLFAVLVSSVLLSIGLSIFNLTVKELTLSSSGRESQFAFYAADSGAECALYWDFKASSPVMFATSSGSQTGNWRDSTIDSNAPSCVSASLVGSMKAPTVIGPSSATTQFSFQIPSGAATPYYVEVLVKKLVVNGLITTKIDSRGYNTSDINDSNRVERALRVCYGPDCASI
ncbi:MAG: hypothetical protein WC767_01990 [Candidatus Paceibacterota bacterium]|jgi:Tfp pilus assembly protein PilX